MTLAEQSDSAARTTDGQAAGATATPAATGGPQADPTPQRQGSGQVAADASPAPSGGGGGQAHDEAVEADAPTEDEQVREGHRGILSTLLMPWIKIGDDHYDKVAAPVDFRRIVNYRDGRDSYYVFTIVDPRTGAEVETKRIDAGALHSLSTLQDALRAAAGCLIATHRRGSPKWWRAQKAIEDAAEVLTPPEPAANDWRDRLERYLHDRLTQDRDAAAAASEPFVKDGRIHVNRPAFQHFVNRSLSLHVTKAEVLEALRDHLGGEHTEFNYAVVDRGGRRRRQRDYWKLPAELTGELVEYR